MIKEEHGVLSYYLFSIANLLAAIGGGLVLGNGIKVIEAAYLQNGTMLAFFIGTLFGLFFLKLVPKKWPVQSSYLFSIFCAITSIFLCYLFNYFSLNGKMMGLNGFIFSPIQK